MHTGAFKGCTIVLKKLAAVLKFDFKSKLLERIVFCLNLYFNEAAGFANGVF